MNYLEGALRAIFIEPLDKTAVFDFLQDGGINEIARVERLCLRSGFGEMIDDRLNSFQRRIGRGPNEPLAVLIIM